MIFDDDHPRVDEMRARPAFFIGVVAEMTEVHPQTLRHYERVGLLAPSRTRGNVRIFSLVDVERVRLIKRLITELGVNLAGVEVILNMRDRYERQAAAHRAAVADLRRRHEAELHRLRRALRRATQDPGPRRPEGPAP